VQADKEFSGTYFPKNVATAKTAAPDGLPRSATGVSQFRFPVKNRFFPKWLEILLLISIPYIFVLISTLQLAIYESLSIEYVHNLFIVIITCFAIYLLLLKEAMRSRLDQIVVLLTCFIASVVLFSIASWHAQLATCIFVSFFVLDRIVVHGTYMRTGAPRTVENARLAERYLASRFTLISKSPFTLLDYFVPLAILTIACIFTRDSLLDPRGNNHVMFAVSGIVFLILYPIIVDQLSIFQNIKPKGIVALFREYLQLLVSWFAYNPAGASNPAVLHSPSGTCLQRRMAIIGLLLIYIPVVLPASFFMMEIDQKMKNYKERENSLFNPIKFSPQSQAPLAAPEPSPNKSQPELFPYTNEKNSPSTNFESSELRFDTQAIDAALEREQQKVERASEVLERALQGRQTEKRSKGMFDNPADVYTGFASFITGIFGAVLPLMSLAALIFAASARPMAALTPLLGPIPNRNVFTTANWEPLVFHLQNLPDTKENPQILWGVDARDQTPILVPRSALREHVHFIGDTGSGKTSLGISPLLSQLIRSGDCSVVVIDLKGDDLELFENMRSGAEGLNQTGSQESAEWTYPFRFFTSKPDLASFPFNPLDQQAFRELSPLHKADLITTALGLQYGTDYGRKFFGDANFNLLQAAFTEAPNTCSFADLSKVLKTDLKRSVDRETRMAASNLGTSSTRLASIPPLNQKRTDLPNPTAAIDLGQLFEKPQSLFFSLPAATGSVINADVARLVLFSIINAAQRAKKPRTQVFVVVDEFQRAVSSHIEVLLQMARSHDVGLILANQSLNDLRQKDADILSTVTSNTRMRQIFGLQDPREIKDIIEISGNRLGWVRALTSVVGWLTNFFPIASTRLTHQETLMPRLSLNDVIEASDHPLRSIFHMSRGKGLAQFGGYPFILESVFHITEAEHEGRRAMDWPGETGFACIFEDEQALPQPNYVAPVPLASTSPTPPTQSGPPTARTEDVEKLLGSLDSFKTNKPTK